MTPKNKQFDSVQMKRDIQARLVRELSDMNAEQRRQRAEATLRNDKNLEAIWRRTRRPLKRAS